MVKLGRQPAGDLGQKMGARLAVQRRCPAGEDTTTQPSVSREQRRLHRGCREAVGRSAAFHTEEQQQRQARADRLGEEKQSSNVIGFDKAGGAVGDDGSLL
ncbi:hypothetical protein NL676_018528 [Syzygium grande]|nr:hypothetical protein NL676_018528 [Syzygium grande]